MINKIIDKSATVYLYVALSMTVLFAILPLFMVVGPEYYGKTFKAFACVEITALASCIVWYAVVFAMKSFLYSFKDALSDMFLSLKEYFALRRYAGLLLAVYVLTVISALMAPDRTRAFWGTDFRPDGVFMHTAFLALFVFSSALKSRRLKNTVIAVYCICYIFVSLIMVQQYFGIIGTYAGADTPQWAIPLKNLYDSIGIRTGHFYKGYTGTFYNLNHMGYYGAVCSMLFAALLVGAKHIWAKILLSVVCAYSFLTVVINNTFGCYLAVLATLLIIAVFLIVRKEKITVALLPLVIFVLISAVVTLIPPKGASSVVESNIKTTVSDVKDIYKKSETSGSAGSDRWGIWQNTVDMIAEKPLWGFGPDNLKKEYTNRGVKLDRAHCEPLERAVSTGIPSAVFYVSAILLAVCSALKNRRHETRSNDFLAPLMASCAYFISGLVGVFLFYTACHFIIMLAMLAKETDEDVKNDDFC